MTVFRPTYEELQAEVVRLKEENATLRKRLAQFVYETDYVIVPTLKPEQSVVSQSWIETHHPNN